MARRHRSALAPGPFAPGDAGAGAPGRAGRRGKGSNPPRPIQRVRSECSWADVAARPRRQPRPVKRQPGAHRARAYMGASLNMIDPHYGHLARDGREDAIRLLTLGTTRAEV